MNTAVFVATLLSIISVVLCQQPGYASRPYGYPVIITTTTVKPPAAAENGLDNRVGGTEIPTTTERLPVEAGGNRQLIDNLRKLPIDQQPFWLLNWLALEENRLHPQTYNQRVNGFLDAPVSSQQEYMPQHNEYFSRK